MEYFNLRSLVASTLISDDLPYTYLKQRKKGPRLVRQVRSEQHKSQMNDINHSVLARNERQ